MAKISIFPAPKPTPINTVSLRAIGGARPEPRQWLVKKMLPLSGVALLAGQFSAGKTFVGIDLSLSVIFDRQFLNRRVKPGGVLWVAAEGVGELDSRIAASREAKFKDGCPGEIPFLVTEPPADLSPDNNIAWLRNAVTDASVECKENFDTDLRLVVIDTHAAFFNVTDENDNAEAGRLMKLLARVGNENDLLIVVVAHLGKGVDSGVRGASAYGGGADAILTVMASINQLTGDTSGRSIALAKVRGAQPGRLGSFNVQNYVLGFDEDGEPDTAGYVVFAEGAKETVPHATAKSKTKVPRDFTEAFNEALSDHGKDYPIPNGPTVKAVNITEVRNNFARRYITGNPENSTSAKNKAFTRALIAAKGERMIGGVSLSQNVELIWALRD